MNMIKIAHTIFALPFALIGWAFGVATIRRFEATHPGAGDLMAAGLQPFGHFMGFADTPWLWTLIWVLVAMVGARSFAMAVNRIVDARIDARNPRTAGREIPAGTLSPRFATWFALISAGIFLVACWMLGNRTLMLGPVALLVVAFYSFTKRFTALCHIVLGLGLALAPIGGWLAAVGGSFDYVLAQAGGGFAPFGLALFGGAGSDSLSTIPGALAFQPLPALLGLGVMLWVAGFDIIYSLQDEEFDRQEGLHSVPSKLGPRLALVLSRFLHVTAFGAWVAALLFWYLGGMDGLLPEAAGNAFGDSIDVASLPHGIGVMAGAGLLLVGVCLIYEHRLVKPGDLSRVNAAFFTLNGMVSLIFATLVVADLFVF